MQLIFSFRSAVLPWTWSICGHKYISHFLFAKLKIANLWIIDLNSVCRIFLFFATICLPSWIHEQYFLSLTLWPHGEREHHPIVHRTHSQNGREKVSNHILKLMSLRNERKKVEFCWFKAISLRFTLAAVSIYFVSNDDSEITSMA